MDFNEKNTTLTLGVSHDFDSVFPARPDVTNVSFRGRKAAADKDSTDILLGVTQLLTPKTLLTVNFSVGYADGYLNDPYKRVTFERLDTSTLLVRENRPHHRAKEIVYVALNQAVDAVDASVEASYRFYNDSFDINSHTASVQWFQKLGRHVILAPLFRYMNQNAASMYAPFFIGDTTPFATPADAALVPAYYSSDYRLASMNTLTYGVELTVVATDWLHLNFSYSRYEMRCNEQASPGSAFPKADIFTAGARVWF